MANSRMYGGCVLRQTVFSTGRAPAQVIRNQRKKTKKKDRPRRIIPHNAAAVEILTRRAKVQSLSGYVFFNTAGNKIDAGKLKKTFKKACEDSGIASFRFHDLRHTFITPGG